MIDLVLKTIKTIKWCQMKTRLFHIISPSSCTKDIHTYLKVAMWPVFLNTTVVCVFKLIVFEGKDFVSVDCWWDYYKCVNFNFNTNNNSKNNAILSIRRGCVIFAAPVGTESSCRIGNVTSQGLQLDLTLRHTAQSWIWNFQPETIHQLDDLAFSFHSSVKLTFHVSKWISFL